MKSKLLRLIVIAAALVGALLVLAPQLSTARAAGSSNPAVYPPTAKPYGKSYGEWTAIWQKWYLAQPISTNPAFDATGAECNNNQTRQVFMLAGSGDGSPVTRDCTVPLAKPLLVPVINAECSNIEQAPFYGATAADRLTCAQALMALVDTSSLKVTLDGVAINHPERYLFASPDYRFTIPATDNVLGVTNATTGSSTSDGYWLLLRPLSKGKHTLHWEAAIPSFSFTQDVTYNLRVK